MFDVSPANSFSLPLSFADSLEACKDYLGKRAFVVVQFSSKQLIGLRAEDSTRVVVNIEGVAVDQTRVSFSRLAV